MRTVVAVVGTAGFTMVAAVAEEGGRVTLIIDLAGADVCKYHNACLTKPKKTPKQLVSSLEFSNKDNYKKKYNSIVLAMFPFQCNYNIYFCQYLPGTLIQSKSIHTTTLLCWG